MKKVVRLTETQLTRLIKRVIKEERVERIDDRDVKDRRRNNEEVIAMDRYMLMIYNVKDGNKIVEAIKEFLSEPDGEFIIINECGYVDLSDIDFCEYPQLAAVNLHNTPNNFLETQEECYYEIFENGFSFLTDERRPRRKENY